MGLSDVWKKEQFERGEEPADQGFDTQALETGADMVGRVIGDKYIIEKVLGAGGMGVLYLARHKVLPRKYVIKIIRLHLVDQQANVAVRRFKREAKALASVPHRHVVEVVDYDTVDERTPYFVMEYVEGKTLSAFMEDYPMGLPVDLFQTLMEQICDAMARVHKAGIVHRDLKPNNIMIQHTDDGAAVKILDFGLVNVDGAEFESVKLKLTGKGQVLGTPAYMSPEQCQGNPVDHLSDIYAMGLLAHEMLTGTPAVDGESLLEVIEKQLTERPEPIHTMRSEVPRHVSAAVHRALSKDPKDRFASCDDFLKALQGQSDTAFEDAQASQASGASEPVSGRKTSVLALAVGAGLILVGAVLAWWFLK